MLLLGPFQGRPACLEVSLKGKKVGVCASAWIEGESQLVPGMSFGTSLGERESEKWKLIE